MIIPPFSWLPGFKKMNRLLSSKWIADAVGPSFAEQDHCKELNAATPENRRSLAATADHQPVNRHWTLTHAASIRALSPAGPLSAMTLEQHPQATAAYAPSMDGPLKSPASRYGRSHGAQCTPQKCSAGYKMSVTPRPLLL